MASWVDRCVTLWIDATLAAVLVTGFTALAMIQCRQPVRRRAWGRLGLAASLVVVPLAWVSPATRIDLRHPTSSTRTVEFRPGQVRDEAPGLTAPSISRSVVPTNQVGLESRSSWSSAMWTALVLAYGTGLILGLSRLSLGLLGTSILLRRAVTASVRAENLLESLVAGSDQSRRPGILVSERVGRPVLVGFIRPTILIPPELDLPGLEAKLRLGLLHELAHAEVGDSRFGVLATTAQAVWFFLPQVWWVRSQLKLDAEFLADHRAVGRFGTSYHYAQSLVGIAMVPASGIVAAGGAVQTIAQPHVDQVEVVDVDLVAGRAIQAIAQPHPRAEGFASALIQRVQMLLKCPFEVEDQAPRRWVVAASCFTIFWTLAASRLSIQDRSDLNDEVSWKALDEAVYAFRLAELSIAPQLLENRLFDLRFRLPRRFRLKCEVLADPAGLAQMEILGYRLQPIPNHRETDHSAWRQVEIVRDSQGREAVRVDGKLTVANHHPAEPASWLTIRPIPGRITQVRHLELTW